MNWLRSICPSMEGWKQRQSKELVEVYLSIHGGMEAETEQ